MADFTNQLLISSIYHLLNFEKYPSFPVAAREAAIANNFQIVIFSQDYNPVFSVETRHILSIEDMVRKGIEADVKSGGKNTKLSYKGVTSYWGSLTLGEKSYYMMLVDNDDNYQQDDIYKLAEILELAMGMWNYTPERDLTAEWIRALRRGNTQLASTLMEELGIKESQLYGVYFVPAIEDKEAALKAMAAAEEKYGGHVHKVIETREVAGVLLNDAFSMSFGEPEWKSLAREMAEQAGAPKTFHVTGCRSVEDLSSAFKLINETEAFVQLIFPQKHSFSKYEMALANNCVSICMNGGSVKSFYLDLIEPLRLETKDAKSKQLIETLECFMLDSGMNAAKTAKLMKVHANTVQYRIKRIREILRVDITGNTIVPGLMTALAVSRIEKEVKSF
ncbi:MAG: helix-turn-helix domain-containing protein [Firmicutes bacterium]|nr:helix-turn-helix domain-containing protein [Bacillota bacterium]MBR5926572.1 helix-turn-helix domain-containing protein [Bacillota bacterium]